MNKTTDTNRLDWLETNHAQILHSPNTWTKDGKSFYCWFTLSANHTQYEPAPTLREAIDLAIELDADPDNHYRLLYTRRIVNYGDADMDYESWKKLQISKESRP